MIVLQWMDGAYRSDFAGYADEAPHYVTGLMVRDYLAAFPWTAPLPFARAFYDHYPLVAIGHWPPVFYAIQGIWMLIAGPSRASILLLMAVISGAGASALFAFWRPRFGAAAAFALALAFLVVPVVHQHTGLVMAEMVVALFVFLAADAYKRYLEEEHWRHAAWFGVWAAIAILTKPNGLALALLPAFAVAATRRFALVKRFSFWLPALIVLVACAPWYVLTVNMASEGWSASYVPSWLLNVAALQNATHLIRFAGIPIFLLAIAGIVWALWSQRNARVSADVAVMAALLASVWVFHTFVAPVREARHLIPAIPPLLMFAALAIAALATALGVTPGRRQAATAVFAAAIATVFLVIDIRGEPKPRMGSEVAVRHVLSGTSVSAPILVSSASYGEGVFIAELAGRENRPGHRVLRASKVLSTSDWARSGYRLTFDSAEEVDAYLAGARVTLLVIDVSRGSGPPVPHHQQLLEVVQNPRRWRPILAQPEHSTFQVFEAVASD